jgi:hypothetical protein
LKNRVVSPDDVMDIMELADQIQQETSKVLHGQEIEVAVSALLTALVNMMCSQDLSKDQFVHYRDVLFTLFDQIIKRY